MSTRKLVPAWQKGFTLIELLVVIGILGILIAVVLVAVNPSRQFASARDTQRRADLYAVTNALYSYATEHDGNFPDDGATPPVPLIGDVPRDIGTGDMNLAASLVPDYLPEIPMDPGPVGATAAETHYYVHLDANERLVATAASEVNPTTTIIIQR